MMTQLQLNARAWEFVESTLASRDELGLAIHRAEGGGRVIDCGIDAPAGLAAGVFLARLTLADLAEVSLASSAVAGVSCPEVVVRTDNPVAACMASQYAGWQISVGDYFAIGSGPMRAASGGEDLFDEIGGREKAEHAVGALETRKQPDSAVFEYLASKTGVEPSAITLAVAPTASLAGGLQVVARSVETALHKLHAIGFDIARVASGFGSAPLPPPGSDDLAALGRTNDSVLYGSRVTLWVHGDDDTIAELGARTPSSASPDHGQPFVEIFKRYEYDFYKIDPQLFSPAEITFHNLETGRTHSFGSTDPELLKKSFFS